MDTSKTIRVLLVDDHHVVCQGLRYFLSTQPGFEVVGEATSGYEAIALVKQHQPDVVLMDLVMPEMSGIETTRLIKKQFPDVAVLALTSYVDQNKVAEALATGMVGYVMKDVQPQELARAIRSAAGNDMYLSSQAAYYLARQIRNEDNFPVSPDVLTDREIEVLSLLTKGMNNQAIADSLSISTRTVKVHIANIFQKLQVNSRIQAALYALRNKLVMLDDI